MLIVGPNLTFLRYIEQVLPSLGETDVLLSTVGELFPGVVAKRPEPAPAAALKGGLRMADVLARAISDRQRMPGRPVDIRLSRYTAAARPADLRGGHEAARSSRAARTTRPARCSCGTC